jgi:hypothetical protein
MHFFRETRAHRRGFLRFAAWHFRFAIIPANAAEDPGTRFLEPLPRMPHNVRPIRIPPHAAHR